MAQEIENGADGSLPESHEQDPAIHDLESMMREIKRDVTADFDASTCDTKSISRDKAVREDPIDNETVNINFLAMLKGGYERVMYESATRDGIPDDEQDYYHSLKKKHEDIDAACNEHHLNTYEIEILVMNMNLVSWKIDHMRSEKSFDRMDPDYLQLVDDRL